MDYLWPLLQQFAWLIPVGFAVGALGTLIGAGGGFVLVPLLLLAYPPSASPRNTAEILTAISLAVVFFNALSGSIAYARMRRIDYRAGLVFSAAGIPGAVAGAMAIAFIPRSWFDPSFGVLLMLVAAFLFWDPLGERRTGGPAPAGGTAFHPRKNYLGLGGAISVGVGFLSSLLGIGGGIIHVPVMTRVLRFPVHVATATSHFVLVILALTGTLVHVASGTFAHGLGYRRTIFLALGAVVGAQFGAWLSRHIHGRWIIRGLAIALGLVGVRLLLSILFRR